jgi:hypothetical protein
MLIQRLVEETCYIITSMFKYTCFIMFVINNLENFQTNSTLHCINTRHKNQLHRLTVNMSCIQKGVTYSCIKLLNILPSNILKLQNNKSDFKVAL